MATPPPVDLITPNLSVTGRVILIDDDPYILEAFTSLAQMHRHEVHSYPSASAFIQAVEHDPDLLSGPICVVCDVKMPGMDGLQLQKLLMQYSHPAVVLMSGGSGAEEAVQGFRAGALDFLLKPISASHFLDTLTRALQTSKQRLQLAGHQRSIKQQVSLLSEREFEVMRFVARGMTNIGIALQLDISERTVKFHRQNITRKLALKGTSDLVRFVEEFERLK